MVKSSSLQRPWSENPCPSMKRRTSSTPRMSIQQWVVFEISFHQQLLFLINQSKSSFVSFINGKSLTFLTFISKRARLDSGVSISQTSFSFLPRINPAPSIVSSSSSSSVSSAPSSSYSNNFLTAKSLGIHLPSPAPEPTTAESTSIAVDEHLESSSSEAATLYDDEVMASLSEDKSPKKKYAKEAWPGMHSGTPLTNF